MEDYIGLMPKATKIKETESDLCNEQLKVIDEFRGLVENGDVSFFVAFGLDHDGNIIMASQVPSIVDGVGLIETGKLTFMNSYANKD